MPRVASEPSAVPPSRPQPSPRSRADAGGQNPATPFAALLDSADPSAGRPSAKRGTPSPHAERTDRDRSHAAPSRGHSERADSRHGHDGRAAQETDNTTQSKPTKATTAGSNDPKADQKAAAEAAVVPDALPVPETPAVDESATQATAELVPSLKIITSVAPEAPADDDSPETKEASGKDTTDTKPSDAAQPDTIHKPDPAAALVQPMDTPDDPQPAAPDAARAAIHAANGRIGSPRPPHLQDGDAPVDSADTAAKGAAPADPQALAAARAAEKDGHAPAPAKTETGADDIRLAGDLAKKPHADAPVQRDAASGALKAGTDAVQNLGAGAQAQPTTATNAATGAAPGPALTTAAAVPLAGLAVEIATQARAGKHHFDIRLDPPELGRIDVRLDVDGDGNVSSRLIVERSDTLDLLKRDASQLERALQQAGLKTSDNALEFSLRQQAFGQDNAPRQQPVAQLVVPGDDTLPPEPIRRGYGQLYGLGRGLDIRV
ncbi:MAG TPA: flagellar hook-length control protein FliK [Xanthobacteraceae bacterium]|nr:flagellar hook-length control protein FliK [Xanthobacteraceae bacterium]